MADLPDCVPLPTPETDDLGRYLEDTITIDWQTPSVGDCARRLLEGFAEATAEARIGRLFRFVRDEIAHSFDLEDDGIAGAFVERGIACRASEVLALGHGLCFAKSHLLVALLRFAGHPAGFCYARLVDDARPGRFLLHGFLACRAPVRGEWILLDPRGNRGGSGGKRAIESVCRFAPPYSLAYAPDPERGESLLPFIYKRPAKRIVDFLERVPDRATLRRNLPDSIG